MIRVFELPAKIEELERALNDPHLWLISMDFFCSAETGRTTARTRFQVMSEPREILRKRRVRRFFMFEGKNDELNDILRKSSTRLIKERHFFSAIGDIMVIDYEVQERL